MNKVVITAACLFALSGCGLFQAPPTPSPKKVMYHLNQISSGTVVNVVALIPMDTPNPSQPKITNNAVFRVSQDIVGQPNSSILIEQNALITAVYSNDGTTCQLSWQALYPDYRAMELGQGQLSFGNLVNNSSCDPKTGIRPGQLFNIIFK